MTLQEGAKQTEEYWRSFALSDEELEHLHDLIVEAGIPQTTAFFVYEVVEQRCRAEAEVAKAEVVRQRVIPYDPRETFREGQRLLFKRLGIACIIEAWSEHGAYYGEHLAMRVRKEATGEIRVFIAGVRRGFEDFVPAEVMESEDWDLGKPTPYVAPGEVVEQFGDYVRRELTGRLGEDERFINFDQECFLAVLLKHISTQELILAEKRIRQAGEPLKLADLASLPDEPQTSAAFVQHFSWNYALANDTRFDNVGITGTPLWFLRALEPPEAVEKPPRLAIPAVSYTREYQYVYRDLKDTERVIDDEGSEDEAPPPMTAGRIPSVEFVLNFAHRVTGTIPLTSRIRRVFPQANGPRTRITFIDGRSGKHMPGWVMCEDRYAWGLRQWYDENLIWAGTYIRLETTENPLEVVVDYIPLPNPKEERVRVARVVDGRLTFEWQTRTIPYKYDPLMLIAETRFEDMEALWLEAEKVGKPTFEVMCDVFPELARLHPQSHVHACTLYSAVNLVRRCAPGTLFRQLSQRVCFDPVGERYWTYDPDLRDVKVIYRTKKEVEDRKKRGAWYDETKRKEAARKAAETRRKKEAELSPEERAGYKAARTRKRRQRFWEMVEEQVGKELHTLHENNPFTVDEVRERQVKITVGTTENVRNIQRKEIEPAWEYLVEDGSVSRAEIRQQFSSFSPAYVAAILAALPGVTYKTEPIRLFYQAEETIEPAIPDIGIRQVVYPIPFPAGELPEQLLDEPAWRRLFREEQLSLWRRTRTPEALDEALMNLIADKDASRFVTPREVVDFMVNLAQPKPGERVADICCGTGIFLVKALRFVKEVYGEDADLELYGADIYEGAVEAARLNLLANGAHNFTVVQADSLQEQEGIFDTKYDLILGNPPFGGGQMRAFLRRWAEILASGGRMVANVSDGILANAGHSDQALRHWLVSNFELESVVSLLRPRDNNLYGAKSNVIFLRGLRVDGSHQAMLVSIGAYIELPLFLQII